MSSCVASCCAAQRLCPHPPFRFPRQPPAYRSPAALLSTARHGSAIADRTRSIRCQEPEPSLALSQVWRREDGHRTTYRGPTPTPLSTLSRRSSRMKLPFQPPALGGPRHLLVWYALLAPKQPVPLQPRLELSLQPHTNYNRTNPACAMVSSATYSRSLSHNPHTIEFA